MKDAYKIFRELEERNKRTNPYKFYDKDELIDEILKDEDEIERLNNIIKRFEEDLREVYLTFGEFSEEYTEKKIRELKGDESNEF